MRLPIRWKLILALAAPLVLVYATTLWLTVVRLRERSLARLEQQGTALAENAGAAVAARLQAAARGAEAAAAALSSLPHPDRETAFILLHAAATSDPMIVAATLSPAQGASLPEELRVTRDGRQTAGAGSVAPPSEAGWSEPWRAAGGERVCSYAVPVLRDGAVIGTLRIETTPEAILAALPPLGLEDSVFALVGRGGRFVTPPPSDAPGSDTLAGLVQERGRADLAAAAPRILEGRPGVVQAEGLLVPGRRWFLFAPAGSTGWTFLGAVPESVVLAFSRTQLRLGLAIQALGLLAILGVLWAMSFRITRPLERLAGAASRLGSGDLDTRVAGVESRDEIGDLARAFDRMAGDLKSHVAALQKETASREAVESEIRVARGIQTALLPKRFPEREEFDLHALNLPARRVAGDFFDFFLPDGRTLVFLIADVSGKGVPAAFFMAVARTVLRQALAQGGPLSDAVARANALLEADNPGSMYATLFVGCLDLGSGAVRYVNGAHPAPYRLGTDGAVSPFGETTGTMVGLLPAKSWSEGAGLLRPGERLVLFTDGVPEAKNPAGEFLGEERFETLLGELARLPAKPLCEEIARRVDEYQAGNRYDDLTLLVVGRR